MKNETTQGGLLFIGLKLSAPVYKLEPLLIVLELINSGSGLKLLLMKVLSVAVQTRTTTDKLNTYQQRFRS
jgi:hypothetical protein